jgi:hypothetical protein
MVGEAYAKTMSDPIDYVLGKCWVRVGFEVLGPDVSIEWSDNFA